MSDASLVNLTIDRNLDQSLFEQIYDALRDRIVSGALKAGDRLPSSRVFAAELGVSRSSVVNAYDQLVVEGYAESRVGSGLYVCDLPELDVVPVKTRKVVKSVEAEESIEGIRAFFPGLPDMRLFPYDKWARCVSRVARDNPKDIIIPRWRFGDMRLREAIARHLLEWRGFAVSPEQIVITAGALGGLELLSLSLLKRGETVGLENPGYRAFRRFADSRGMNIQWLPVDKSGAQLPEGDAPRMIILTPSHQYPLGGCMPTARRTEFLNYASANNCWIVEDDFDSEFRFSGKPIQALAGMDQDGRVFYVGSFSKIFSDGLRLGYLVVPEKQVGAIADAISKHSNPVSLTSQLALAVFMESGEFHRHIRKMRRTYAGRRRVFLDNLTENNLPVQFEDYQAGMQIAVFLDGERDDVVLSNRAGRVGVQCAPLSSFYAKDARSGLLLGFCSFQEEEIEMGMKVLAEVIKMPDSQGSQA